MRCAWMAAMMLAAGCAGRPASPAVPDAQTYLYECGSGMSVVARIEPASAWVALPTKTVRLVPVQTESGARYEGDGVLLWMRGEHEAFLEVDGQRFESCTGGRYADVTISLRAVAGHERPSAAACRRRAVPCRA